MITADDVRTYKKREPLVSFHLTSTAGQTHDVLRPDLVIAVESMLAVGSLRLGNTDCVPDTISTLLLAHSASITTIDGGA